VRKRPAQPEHLTTSEAAALLGVSVATLKRWSEAGLLGPRRTRGGHRRFSRAELQAFLERPGPRDEAGARADALFAAAGPLEMEALLFRRREAHGSWAGVADDLEAALAEIGRRAREGRLTAVQRLSTLDRLGNAVASVAAGSVASRGAPRLLVLSVPGDRVRYGAPLAALAAAEAGWEPVLCGAPWPRELAPELARSPPAAVLASASADADATVLARHGPGLHEATAAARIALGLLGPGEWTGSLGGVTRLRRHAEIPAWLADVADRTAAPGAGPAAPGLERLEWHPSLSLGDETLDAQHQVLFRSARKFLDAAASGASKEDVDRLLRFLEDYAEVHFRFEESLMRAHGYPGLDAHAWEHEQFIRRLRAEGPEARSGTPGAVRTLAELVRAWLARHVGGSDQRVGAHIRHARRLARGRA